MLIDDGQGNGYSAGVDSHNRLLTESVVLSALGNSSHDGAAFNILTGYLTLTNAATENGTLYIANSDPRDMVLDTYFISLGKASTSGNCLLRSYANPTGGTLLTAGTAVTPVQRNFGSRATFAVTAKTMASVGQTVTGGTLFGAAVVQDGAAFQASEGIHIPAGSSIAFTAAAPTGNTSMLYCLVVAVYFE